MKIVSVTSAKFGELSVSERDADDNIVSLSYGPKSNNTDFNGLDTFTYTVADQDGNQVTAAVSIDVVPVNDAPEATTAKVIGIEDAVVSGKLTGSDVDGDALSFALVSAPSSGTLSISPNGTYTYTLQVIFSMLEPVRHLTSPTVFRTEPRLFSEMLISLSWRLRRMTT